MTDLVLSRASSPNIERLSQSLPQALLLSGMTGVGLHTIAKKLAATHGDIISIRPQLLTKTSTVPQISIEKIRELYEQTRTRSSKGRVIVIDDADAMTIPAQNAFLKLLEEPNQSTKFILTSHRPESLLPTIRSRVQSCHITPVTKEQTLELLGNLSGVTAQKRAQLLFIAEGLPAELYRLTGDEMVFREKASLIGTAKRLIEGDKYTRLVTLQKEKLTRHSADMLAEQLIVLLSKNPTPAGVEKISRLLAARESLATGGNLKLQLLTAML